MDQETRRHVYWCGDAETKLACHNKADKSSESQQGGPFIVTSQHSVANDMSISCWFQESFLLKKNFFLLCEEVQENSFGSFTRVVTKFCRLLEY